MEILILAGYWTAASLVFGLVIVPRLMRALERDDEGEAGL